MTIELLCLFWATVLLFVLIGVQGALTPLNQGFAWGLGPRDERRERSVMQGRMDRVVRNHIEGLVVFAGLVLVAHLGGISTPATETGAILFLAARVAYAPVYALGVPYARTAVWAASAAGLLAIAAAILNRVL